LDLESFGHAAILPGRPWGSQCARTLAGVPPEIEPPELARLVDYAERPRSGDWSLRSALVRYAQPEPARVGQVLELVRRIEFALAPHAKLLQREGPKVWQALASGDGPDDADSLVVGLLQANTELDGLAELLTTWAVDRATDRPDAAVDAVVASVTRRLDDLGVAREERPGPPSRRG
jgi:hypothetical protein